MDTVKFSTDKFAVHYDKKTCDCKLQCDMCGACSHMCTCSCLDATLHYTVCKHVHLVQMKLSKNGTDIAIGAVEQAKNKCSHMKIHMISETPEELPVPCDSQGTKTEKNVFIDLEEQDVLMDIRR